LKGEIESAFYYYWLALKESNNDLSIIGKYGQMAIIIGNYQEALDAFKQILVNEPRNDIAWHNCGVAYYGLGKMKKAISHLEKAIKINEDSGESHYILAAIFAELYLLDKALYHLDAAINIEPTFSKRVKNDYAFKDLENKWLFEIIQN
jgi:tetratricopeptide (TPR) repeat protein